MPVVVKSESTGTKRKPIQGVILLGLGYSWVDVKKMLGTSSSRISAWMKDPDLLAILEAVKALPLENHAKGPALKPEDCPKNSASTESQDPKTLAHSRAVALLDSKNEAVALRAVEIILRHEAPAKETDLSDFDHLFPGDAP